MKILQRYKDKKTNNKVKKLNRLHDDSYITSRSLSEKQLLNECNKNIMEICENNSYYMAKNKKWLTKYTYQQKQREASHISDQMSNKMFMMTVMPLARGISVDAVCQSVGTFLGMAVMNPEYRNHMAKSIGAMAQRSDFGPMKLFGDKLISGSNAGKEVWTPTIAASHRIGITRQTYEAILNGEDKEVAMANYHEAMEIFNKQAEADGYAKEDIDKAERILVARYIQSDDPYPYDKLYEQTATGKFTPSTPNTDYKAVNKDGEIDFKTVYTWDGEYSDEEGNILNEPFKFRMPNTTEASINNIFSQMYASSVKYRKESNMSPTDSFPDDFHKSTISTAARGLAYFITDDDVRRSMKINWDLVDEDQLSKYKDIFYTIQHDNDHKGLDENENLQQMLKSFQSSGTLYELMLNSDLCQGLCKNDRTFDVGAQAFMLDHIGQDPTKEGYQKNLEKWFTVLSEQELKSYAKLDKKSFIEYITVGQQCWNTLMELNPDADMKTIYLDAVYSMKGEKAHGATMKEFNQLNSIYNSIADKHGFAKNKADDFNRYNSGKDNSRYNRGKTAEDRMKGKINYFNELNDFDFGNKYN